MVFNYDESIYVSKAIDEVWGTLGLAFVLVVIIIWLFLGSVRSTLIPAVAIPVSIIGTFAILHALGYSINILTMLALVLSIGVVVDDAIVVLENIHRHIEQGMKPMAAAFKGMEEIAFAVIAITISLIACSCRWRFRRARRAGCSSSSRWRWPDRWRCRRSWRLSLSPMMAARIFKPIDHSDETVLRDPLVQFAGRLFHAHLRTRAALVARRIASSSMIVAAGSLWLDVRSVSPAGRRISAGRRQEPFALLRLRARRFHGRIHRCARCGRWKRSSRRRPKSKPTAA